MHFNTDRYIEIQQATETIDTNGQAIQTWSRWQRARAKVESVSPSEIFTADRTVSKKVRKFTFRYLDGVTPKMRILYESEYYNILLINELEQGGRHFWLQITGELVS